MNKTTTKVDVALNEVKELKTLILTENIVHFSKIIESIITLVKHYNTKAKMFTLNEVTELKTLISTLLDEKNNLFSPRYLLLRVLPTAMLIHKKREKG